MTVIRKPGVWLLLALLLPMSGPALSGEPREETPQDDTKASQELVFRGRPLPWAQSFVITEFGLALHRIRQEDFLWTWELGWMKNLNRRFAVGAAMSYRWDADRRFGGRLIAAKVRLRYWPQRLFSVDVAPGIILGGRSGWGDINTPSFTGHVGVGFADWISAVVDFQHYNRSREEPDYWGIQERNEVLLYVGLRAGSYPGAVSGAAAGVLAILVHGFSYW